MALGTGAITLQQICNEIAGGQDDLLECFNEANGDFNLTYSIQGVQAMSEFRGYNDTPAPSTQSIILVNNNSGLQAACTSFNFTTYYINSGATLLSANSLWTNAAGTIFAPASNYSDGNSARNWNGSNFGSATLCFQ